MKQIVLLLCATLCARDTFAQRIFFPRTNYADSAVFEKNIGALAKQVIDKYQEPDSTVYAKNLGYLFLAAGAYSNVERELDKYASLKQYDSGQYGLAEMAARVYCQTMTASGLNDPSFETVYRQKLADSYSKCKDLFSKVMADDSYSVVQGEYNALFKNVVKSIRDRDSLSIHDALNLCVVHAHKMVFADVPLGIGRRVLDTIADDKYIIEKNVLVRMPGGAQINLSIVRSKNALSPQPVVMLYNIYSGFDVLECTAIARNGYIGVVANTRGKTLSPDAIEPLEHDAEDAYYIIDWISKQPWCNGKIGMYGGSYLGFSQWATVKHLHQALKTIVPQVAVGAGIDFPMQNGIFSSYSLRWLHYVMDEKLTDDDDFGNDKKWNAVFGAWFKNGYRFRSLDSQEGTPNYVFRRWLQHPAYDRYWQKMTPQKQEFSKINIPVFTISGYWDDDQIGAMYYYKQHNLWNKSTNDYLLLGPYDHGGSQGRPAKILEGYQIDSVANISIYKLVFQWMDYILKDSSRPAILKDRVNFEVMGKNEWRHVSSLDQMHNDSIRFYFGSTPDAKQQYSLINGKPERPGYIPQTVDLKDRSDIRFKEGDIDAFEKLVDSTLNPEKEKLYFISEPVETPFAISGSVKASIKVTINKKDLDLVMDIYEQTPDGKFLALNENVQRASYAGDREQRQLLQPGKPNVINLTNTFITSRQMQKGSRVIVLIGVNKSPEWQINYGTGKDVSEETIDDAATPLQLKWYNESYIQFPILR
jgi:putative CocE/NonD family hydrolase